MGKKWIYCLKKEDFAKVAQRLNVALDCSLEDMRKALSEYYSETESDPQLIVLNPFITIEYNNIN